MKPYGHVGGLGAAREAVEVQHERCTPMELYRCNMGGAHLWTCIGATWEGL